MIRRRLEKLELKFPPSTAILLERLDCRAMATLSRQQRILVNETYAKPRRKRVWSAEHHVAVALYGEALALQMQDVSDDELNRLVAQVESRTGLSVSTMETAPI